MKFLTKFEGFRNFLRFLGNHFNSGWQRQREGASKERGGSVSAIFDLPITRSDGIAEAFTEPNLAGAIHYRAGDGRWPAGLRGR